MNNEHILGTGDGALMTAEQCRKLGVKIGDVIVGRETYGDDGWSEAELTLLWLGKTVAVFRTRHRGCHRGCKSTEWGKPVESGNWTLAAREWKRVT